MLRGDHPLDRGAHLPLEPQLRLLQYKQIGKWRDYLFGEKVYIFLSLTAKALLAWQMFAGTLMD